MKVVDQLAIEECGVIDKWQLRELRSSENLEPVVRWYAKSGAEG